MPDSNREPGRTAASTFAFVGIRALVSKVRRVGRYRWNLLILVFFLILLTFWFYRHLHLYVTHSILIGGTVTLWGVWKVVQSTFRSWLGSESATWTQQFLGRPGATEYLIFGLVVLVILWLTTSSIYLVYEGAEEGESPIKVQVFEGRKTGTEMRFSLNPILEKEVTSLERIQGRPFFFRFRIRKFFEHRELGFVIASGRYQRLQKTFRPWSNLYVKVPSDFEPKSFHLLRLIPRNHLGRLPSPEEEDDADYFLTVEVNGKKHEKEDLRFQTVYLGAAQGDLERLVGEQDPVESRRQLERLLPPGMPAADQQEWLNDWESDPLYIETAELEAGNQVVVKVGRRSELRLWVERTIDVPEKAIHTVPLDRDVSDESQENVPDESTNDFPAASPE